MSVPDLGNRRHSQRHEARHEICLQADLSLFDTQIKAPQGKEPPLTIFGNTQDLSEEGMSLIVPLVPLDESFCYEEAHRLALKLYLPTGEVTMQIAPVRCCSLDEEEPGEGFFMGAQITEIDSGERTRFIEYLRTVS